MWLNTALISSNRKLASKSGAVCFFHFVRRFWNHVLIWVSERRRLLAKLFLSVIVKYFLSWNISSRDCNWVLVKAVRLLRVLLRWTSSRLVEQPLLSTFPWTNSPFSTFTRKKSEIRLTTWRWLWTTSKHHFDGVKIQQQANDTSNYFLCQKWMACHEPVSEMSVCDSSDTLCLPEGVGLSCFGAEFPKIALIVNDAIKMWSTEGQWIETPTWQP